MRALECVLQRVASPYRRRRNAHGKLYPYLQTAYTAQFQTFSEICTDTAYIPDGAQCPCERLASPYRRGTAYGSITIPNDNQPHTSQIQTFSVTCQKSGICFVQRYLHTLWKNAYKEQTRQDMPGFVFLLRFRPDFLHRATVQRRHNHFQGLHQLIHDFPHRICFFTVYQLGQLCVSLVVYIAFSRVDHSWCSRVRCSIVLWFRLPDVI